MSDDRLESVKRLVVAARALLADEVPGGCEYSDTRLIGGTYVEALRTAAQYFPEDWK